MRLQPVIGWWLLLPFVIAGLATVGWRIYELRHDKHRKRLMLPWLRRAIMVLLLGLMVLGPSVPGGVTSPGVANLDVVFAVDTTASMGALDYDGEKLRIEGVKRDMLALSERLKGAHFAIITFDSNVDPLLPMTSDYATFTAAVKTINREIYNTSNGSSIDKGIETITKQLKNSKTAYPERSRLLYYLGDGEQTIKNPVKSFKDMAELVDGGAVLGYGTAKGAKMIKHTGLGGNDDKPSYIMTPDTGTKKLVPAVSKLDESALKKIASELKITYQNRNKADSVENLFKESKAELLIDRGKRIAHYLNIYWLFAVPFAGLLFWEWREVVLQLLTLRQQLRGGRHAKN